MFLKELHPDSATMFSVEQNVTGLIQNTCSANNFHSMDSHTKSSTVKTVPIYSMHFVFWKCNFYLLFGLLSTRKWCFWSDHNFWKTTDNRQWQPIICCLWMRHLNKLQFMVQLHMSCKYESYSPFPGLNEDQTTYKSWQAWFLPMRLWRYALPAVHIKWR